MQQHEISLETGQYYHIYNRGINKCNLFRSPHNYRYFLKQYTTYLHSYLETYAYCLLGNHFHLLVRVKEPSHLPTFAHDNGLHSSASLISKQFAKLFSSYTQSFNKAFDRTGSLFESPFKRKLVESESYLVRLVCYIHTNPQLHGLTTEFQAYPYSSYQSILQTERATRLERRAVLALFGDQEAFANTHENSYDFNGIQELLLE